MQTKTAKGKMEIRLTEEEKVLIRVNAVINGKNINRYLVDLVKQDQEQRENKSK